MYMVPGSLSKMVLQAKKEFANNLCNLFSSLATLVDLQVLYGLAKHAVVHQLEEVHFEWIHGLFLLCVLLNVRHYPIRTLSAVNFPDEHSKMQAEL